MKTKKFTKKLVLTKETVADLNDHEMKGVYGGLVTDLELSRCVTNCPTCFFTQLSNCCY